jgi:glycosyltransferase involved in cell wall biosynthesis
MHRMRILHVHSGNLYGGVETLLRTLAECRWLCPEMEPEFALCFDGRIASELRQAGTRVHMLGGVRVRNPVQVMRARRRLMRILSAGAFDAVICHMAWPLAIFGQLVRRLGLPLIFWMHNAVVQKDWLGHWASLSRPDLVICNSRFTASTLGRLFTGVQFEVLYCPVMRTEKTPGATQRSELRSRLNTAPDALVVMQASRMEPGKGHELLLEALALLANLPRWVCWIVGGSQREEEVSYVNGLHARAIDLGIEAHIRFLEHRSDVAELMLAADIYCQPNLGTEGFGIAFIEAMYAGLPVVATAAGGPMEILDESCGALVPPQNATLLAARLEGLMSNEGLRRKLGDAAVRRAAQLCDPATQLCRLHDMIMRVAAHGVIESPECRIF